MKDILVASIKKFCINNNGECKSSFFEHWFTKNGKTYNFLFKQNLFVTNIQFRELIDLIQLNTLKDNKRPQLIFMNTNDLITLINNIILSFIDEKELEDIRTTQEIPYEIMQRLILVCDNYVDIIGNTIVVDAYYTSCIVSIPPGLDLDLQTLCFQSGYLHSCGENIYTRNIVKAKYDNFVKRLVDFFKAFDDEQVLNFIMYTHEDFTNKNKQYINDFQKHGLDEVKFYIEKYYMQDTSLLEIVSKLKNDDRIKKNIKISKKHEAKNQNNEQSIWMIIDRSIGVDLKYPGDKKYYICYNQLYINENPFHVFEENKPGWINNVTIPHTLSGAMLNIGRCGCLNSTLNPVCKFIDPFVGAGTTFLESMKFDDITFNGGDLSNVTSNAILFNLKFFSLETNELEEIATFILANIKHINEDSYNNIVIELGITKPKAKNSLKRDIFVLIDYFLVEFTKQLRAAEDVFEKEYDEIINTLYKQMQEGFIDVLDAPILKKYMHEISELWVFLAWRSYKRNDYLFKNDKSISLSSISINELKALYYRMSSFINLRKRSIRADNTRELDTQRNTTFIGKYSKGCTINYKCIQEGLDNEIKKIQSNIDVNDFLAQYQKSKVDLIITDPPYGFNTIEEIATFSKLYIKFIHSMAKCMKMGVK